MKSCINCPKHYAYWMLCGLSYSACVPPSSICFIIITSHVHPVITKYTIVLLCATMLSITHRSSCTTFSTSNNRPVIKIETSCPILRFIAAFCPQQIVWYFGHNNQIGHLLSNCQRQKSFELFSTTSSLKSKLSSNSRRGSKK